MTCVFRVHWFACLAGRRVEWRCGRPRPLQVAKAFAELREVGGTTILRKKDGLRVLGNEKEVNGTKVRGVRAV